MDSQKKELLAIQSIVFDTPKHFVVFSHTHPDGDAIGSGLAMQFFLQQFNHKVDFIIPDTYPDFLDWMPNISDIIIANTENESKLISILSKADYFVFVDLNSISRLGSLAECVGQFISKTTSILIDHHINPNTCFTHIYHSIAASSTSELLFKLIDEMGKKDMINKQIAECLYVGIMTDTGSFSYSSNNPYTYEVVKHIVSFGVDTALIQQMVYNTFTDDKIKLLGYSIFEKLKIFKSYKSAYISLSADELNRFNYKIGDTEGLVNYTLKIKDIHFGALITEMDGFIKISFRSIGKIDVNEIAKKNFQGGGHKNASGANFYGTIEEACAIMDTIIKTQLNIL